MSAHIAHPVRRRWKRAGIGLVLAMASSLAGAPRSAYAEPAIERGERTFACGHRSASRWLDELQAAARRGEIPDPTRRPIPPIAPGAPQRAQADLPALDHDDVFPFEDATALLLTDFSDGELFDLMIDAANDLMSVHGDHYDFVGYWLNYAPHHQIGAAFHLSFENDVSGIGAELYELRGESGLGGDSIEGFVMMWNIDSPQWQPGSGPEADYTRLVLGHELEHRFALFLPDLLDGRRLQGGCQTGFHWNPKVDGQASAMDIAEWVGSSPASLVTEFGFNTDIPGGMFSYTDLYLMGYVTTEEMDSGNSELRFMDNWGCALPFYSGTISSFSSEDIVAAAGPRVPDASSEDKHYRTAWIMIHLPGDPPTSAQLDKAIGILEQNTIDWSASTLGRGTMDNSLEDDPTDAFGAAATISTEVRLEIPNPNPLTDRTSLRYSLPADAHVTVTIHDVTGRRVVTLIDEAQGTGWQSVDWNGRGADGAIVAGGTYFVRLVADGTVRTAKLIAVR